MNRKSLSLAFPAAAFVATLLLANVTVAQEPPPQLVITSVLTDLDGPPCMLMARGRNFGRSLSREPIVVRLADEPLDVITFGDTWVVADFDCATPPGDYLLSIKRGPSQTDHDSPAAGCLATTRRRASVPVGLSKHSAEKILYQDTCPPLSA